MDWREAIGAVDGLCHWGQSPAGVAEVCRGQLVYVATPYSRRVVNARGEWHRDKNMELVVEAGFQVARLVRLGVCAVSPIVSSGIACEVMAGLCDRGGVPDGLQMIDPLDADAWEDINRPLLDASVAVVVPDLPGWYQSAGVLDEIHISLRANRRVFFYSNWRGGVV